MTATPENLRSLAAERRQKFGNRDTRLAQALDGAADLIERLDDTIRAFGQRDIVPITDRDAEVDRLEAALHQIDSWSRAYPLKAFPEPDMAKAAKLLKAGGMTLDAISASNMRHVVEGVGKIARTALGIDEQSVTEKP